MATTNLSHTYRSATGPIEFTFLNDYMFHIVFQNVNILTGFLCALLHLLPSQIRSVVVTNPIKPGESIDAKAFVLDIHVTLNDFFIINLELQVINLGDWQDRSLGYLCRTFDNLYRGEDYKDTRAALHIGILDFTLFPKYPEFYAVNKLMNVKNHQIYSDKFQLNVLDLNQIALATEKDKAYGLDHWAALFKATTWEEIKMLAAANSCIDDAAQKLYESCADFMIRENCRARREHERMLERLAQLEDEKNTWEDEKAALQDEVTRLREQLAQYAPQ